ncbi:hypothetical protein JX265_004172 [Neoarthrinium moseri]|uniref:Clr5 domain-containing protein n=1 Tax=Neoarthrinium moseri TaxID=1658444 RepID=A0A9P9WRY0_9PEZI|nr:hypothetical protein JX265_004172 [Neoarthrinium moseri]
MSTVSEPEQAQRTGEEKFLGIPYNERWEYLKPHIVSMFMAEGLNIQEIATRMKERFDFAAVPDQYKYQLFRKWRIKRRTTKNEKELIIAKVGKRSRSIPSSSHITIDSGGYAKPVDKKQLKRYIGESIRHSDNLQIKSAFFLNWNLPYKSFMSNLGLPHDHPSPLARGPPTPDNSTATTPQSSASPSAGINCPSPTTQLVLRKVLVDKSKLLLQGRELELLKQLSEVERAATVTWMHDYWMYAFMTAKYWGKGPRYWSPSMVNFKSMGTQQLLESSSPEKHTASNALLVVQPPSLLCHWTIHHEETNDYEELPVDEREADDEGDYDVDDETTWPAWTQSVSQGDYTETIREGLITNSFSSLSQGDLPVSTDMISKSCAKADERQKTEALGFAIMARNLDIVDNIMDDVIENEWQSDISEELHPCNLAAAYLDGSRQCCLVMRSVSYLAAGTLTKDEHNHSILDSLFITILRSHTSVSPALVSASFQKTNRTRFAGEEVDICGRWDADSPQVRQLFASGHPCIPQEWKHNFCHTSTQAICHSIQAIFGQDDPPYINEQSGLFTVCEGCGRAEYPRPLHTLVRVAFYLAQDGCEGETLFGALACLVCLVIYGADPLIKANTSVPSVTTLQSCRHVSLTAFELATHLTLHGAPGPERVLGWNVFMSLLEYITKGAEAQPRLSQDELKDHDEGGIPFEWAGDRKLPVLWSAIQTEFLSYRKIEEDDPSISPRFNMETLFDGLRDGHGPVEIELIQMRMMNIREDGFLDAKDGISTVTDACSSYYANVERWGRIKFIARCMW